ncbi:hypothetical protein OQH61_02590 [Helicobacter sp. MIT 21-1697]|uniref:hypothetical protein n=1 Tax=Helicobacter sp. MIT 21-1697 TaxID=2993733 RepID=UPI00224B122D|nr:hypothetical protein [Helicobacter sp. MIT 21-1697]MCX2716619.1 hypothetical protein [Helicobacter sp. MIT 21-1697]
MQCCAFKFVFIIFFLCVTFNLALAGGNAAINQEPNPFSFPKDGSYYLERNTDLLEAYLEQVKKQTLEQNYPLYSSKPARPIVEYSAYRTLSQKDKTSLRGALVLVGAFISEFIRYSNFGGVGIGAKLKPNDEHTFYLNFDGRYLTDMGAFGIGRKIFAYCVLPRFDKCIMLGIGEEW